MDAAHEAILKLSKKFPDYDRLGIKEYPESHSFAFDKTAHNQLSTNILRNDTIAALLNISINSIVSSKELTNVDLNIDYAVVSTIIHELI